MRRENVLCVVGAVCAVCVVPGASALADSVAVSIAVRETGSLAPLGEDGGTTGGIEWVNRDLNNIPLDGGWHFVSFPLADADLTPFAGVGADGVYSTARGTLEHIRILNTGGSTQPLRFFIDDLVITDPTGAQAAIGWEGVPAGAEHVFHQPSHSGSTNQNLAPGDWAGVSFDAAQSGAASYQADMRFIDNDPSRWVRFYTFNTPSGGNPTVDFGGTVSFWIKASVVPGPGPAALALVGGFALVRRRRG